MKTEKKIDLTQDDCIFLLAMIRTVKKQLNIENSERLEIIENKISDHLTFIL